MTNEDDFCIPVLLHFPHQTTDNGGSSHPICVLIIVLFHLLTCWALSRKKCAFHISMPVDLSFVFLRISETEELCSVETTLDQMSYYTKNVPWALECGF